MDEIVHAFAADLARCVEEARDDPEKGDASAEVVFTRLVMEDLEDAGLLDSAFDLYQEGRVGNALFRIDGYSLDEDAGIVSLFATHHTGEVPPIKVPAADLTRVAERAMRFVTACVRGLADRIEPSNTEASDLARRVEAIAPSLGRLRIVVLTDGVAGGPLPPEGEWQGKTVDYDLFDIVRLQRVLGDGQTRADISVDFIAMQGRGVPCLPVATANDAYQAYLAAIPGGILSRVYDRYGVRLLELNVRAFLGVQGRKSVNAELRRTIVEAPGMFFAFNNGLVATVDEVVIEEGERGPVINCLRGLQIVNGGQTTASLHRTNRKGESSLVGVDVPVKIIRVTGGDLDTMVSAVSRAANRQNTVQLADFSAGDPFHQEVETLSNNTWLEDGRGRWFYERARGSYVAAEQKASFRAGEKKAFALQTPKARRLNKLDLARYLTAWDGRPHRVALGGQKNFHAYMQWRKDGSPPPPDPAWFRRLVALAILYRSAQRIVKSLALPAYGANVVAYLVAALGQRTGGRIDFEQVWKRQAISPGLEAMLRAWAPSIDSALRSSAGQKNPTEWFKKEECWTAIRDQLPVLTDPLPTELADTTI